MFAWPDGRTALLCLSVRSAFDALLTTLELAAGSEIIFSAVNIDGMAQVALAHGLALRTADIALDTLAASPAAIVAAMTHNTRVVLVSHLYGASEQVDELAGLCRDREVLLVEDGAQAWSDQFRGSASADVSLFSFGPIKTATALGGAVMVIREPARAQALHALLGSYPEMPDSWFARRLVKYGMLRAASNATLYAAVFRALRFAGRHPDETIAASARGFRDGALLPQLRKAPPGRLLRMVERRVTSVTAVPKRVRKAERFLNQLEVTTPGCRAFAHARWVTPILVDDPDRLISHLRPLGFDATRGATSLRALQAAECPEAARLMRHVVYMPSTTTMPDAEVDRLAVSINRWIATGQGAALRP